MAYELFYKYLYPHLQDSDLSFFRLFQYITFRSAYAAITALILSFIIAPKLIRFLKSKKLGQPIRDDGPESHFHKSGTPTMGGILILSCIVISTLFWGRLDIPFVLMLVFATVAFGFIGFIDDYKKLIKKDSKGLAGKKKLFWQFTVSVIILIWMSQSIYMEYISRLPLELQNYLLSGEKLPMEEIFRYIPSKEILPLYIPFFDKPVIDLGAFSFTFYMPILEHPVFIPYVYIIFGVLIVAGFSNAVNLTDGLDGLAIGLLIFVGIAFGLLAYLTGHTKITDYLNIAFVSQAGELTVFTAAFVGAAMGFLWYNSHPAQVFMGDTGSLALGGVIGILALMIKKEVLLLIVGGVFVVETLSVVIQVLYYKWRKKRFFKMAPIHHHFELSGWHESKVIIRFWIIGAALALIALSTLKIQ